MCKTYMFVNLTMSEADVNTLPICKVSYLSNVGTSAIQIWTALIAILILKYLSVRSTVGWSLSNLVALLRLNLFYIQGLIGMDK